MLEQMSSPWAALLWLTRVQEAFRRWVTPQACQRKKEVHRPVALAAQEMGHSGIWAVEASVQVLAHIAYWHRWREIYRGHLLCTDQASQTFLIDLRSSAFLQAAPEQLLQIGGREQAKRFVDALWRQRGKDQPDCSPPERS